MTVGGRDVFGFLRKENQQPMANADADAKYANINEVQNANKEIKKYREVMRDISDPDNDVPEIITFENDKGAIFEFDTSAEPRLFSQLTPYKRHSFFDRYYKEVKRRYKKKNLFNCINFLPIKVILILISHK
jgi:t-SNARE complex subunit (syntaxin)